MSIGVGIAISPSFEGSHIPGVSALFSYPKNSYNQGEADPTPTITGTPGGTFSGSTGIVFVDSGSNTGSSTGQIDLSASSILGHTITYTISGVSSNFELLITAIPYQSTRSFSFDGVNDYFDVGTISLGSTFSLSTWIKPNAFSASTNIIFGGGAGNYAMYIPSSTVIWVNFGGGFHNFTVPSISTSDFTHILFTRTGANGELFVNGVSQGTTSSLGTNTFNVNYLGSENQTGATRYYFNGNLDEVSMWNSALSTDAVTEIYNSGAGNFDLTNLTHASSSNLKAWLKMGE